MISEEQISLGGAPVPGFALGFGSPGDWYYTRWVYPDDVKEAKMRVNAKYVSVDRDVKACATLTADERTAWNDLFTAWRKLFCRSDDTSCTDPDVSIWGLGGQLDDVERYEKYVYDWQLKLKSKTCTPSAPVDKPDVLKREENAEKTDVLGTVKVVAIAIAATAAIVYVAPKVVQLISER